MAKNPSFPFYYSDWLGSTNRMMMSLEEQGAYINLLCHQWASPDCGLPDDDEALAALSGMGERWLNGGSRLLRKCFPSHPTKPGLLANEKLLVLRAERDEWVRKSSEGGKKSAKVRRLRSKNKKTSGKKKGGSTTVRTKGATKRQPNGNSPSPSPSPSPSSSTKKKKSPLVPLNKISYPPEMDTLEVRRALLDWAKHKASIGERYTNPVKQLTLLLNRPEWIGQPEKFVKAVTFSIGQNYRGVYVNERGRTQVPRNSQEPSPGQRFDPQKPCDPI